MRRATRRIAAAALIALAGVAASQAADQSHPVAGLIPPGPYTTTSQVAGLIPPGPYSATQQVARLIPPGPYSAASQLG